MNNTDGQIGTCSPWGQRDIFHPSYGQVKRHQEETDNLHSVWAPSSGLSGLWIGTCRYFLPNFFLCTLFLQAGLTRRKRWDLVLLRVILLYTIPRMFEYFKGQQLFRVQFCTTTCPYSALDIWSYNIWAKDPARDPSQKLCTARGRCFSSYTRQQQKKLSASLPGFQKYSFCTALRKSEFTKESPHVSAFVDGYPQALKWLHLFVELCCYENKSARMAPPSLPHLL